MQIISISEEKKMYNTAQDVQELAENIKKSAETLKGIDLSENSFSPEALLPVLAELGKVEGLEIVVFRGIFTQRVKEQVYPSLRDIVKYISPLKKVSYFDISDNALSMNGMEILVPLIESMHALKHLVMNNNGIGIDGGEFLAKALEKLSAQSTALESLEVGRNRLEDSATKLGKALAMFPYFDVLKIYQNSISSINIGDLLSSLENQSMRVLDISDNFLLEHGSTVLSGVVASWPIEYLNISDCMMSDKGIEVFARSIPSSVALQGELVSEKEIDMSYNDITEGAIEHIRAVLQKMHSTRLVLTGNELAKEAVESLCKDAEETTCEIHFEEEEDDDLVFSSEEKEESADTQNDQVIKKIEEQIAELAIQRDENGLHSE
ncbi:Ran GTPase-activating protein 1 [Nematocida major]|uniref:Ran GTPase-activating protein 1 n=1 Tax=Nematocida major TaxID=1912982 RepID=UPI002007C8F0|nr:Ran GTPase-activating protein 1 [Nematocida major]KAH9385433.1 Ran GTPase-activating protein 1 [Nematocida major]